MICFETDNSDISVNGNSDSVENNEKSGMVVKMGENKPTIYICDPSKNTECLRKNQWCKCQDDCNCTTNKEAAADAFYIKENIEHLIKHLHPKWSVTINKDGK